MHEEEPFRIQIDSTLAARRAGTSAAEMSTSLRREAPMRSFVARMLGVHTDERAWSRGAQGERLVGAELAKLSSARWAVFHDIPIGSRGANVDHLVIGPGGVFSLNTKNVNGKVWLADRVLLVNGHRTDYLPKARREAERVSRCLTRALGRPVDVHGVLVMICDELTVKQQPSDVTVARRRRVVRWLEARPVFLGRKDAIDIAAKANLEETWT